VGIARGSKSGKKRLGAVGEFALSRREPFREKHLSLEIKEEFRGFRKPAAG